jgi:hypothetical protein
VAVIVGISLACAGVKRPWRDYSPIPFSSAAWLAGDKVERGRMLRSMFRNPEVDVSNRDAALKTVGEADLKKTIENREVWFYRIDQGIVGAMDLIPVSFDAQGRGSIGMVKGGTMSIAAKEDEL